MISNYHTASSGPENDYYYTFGGFDEGNPTTSTHRDPSSSRDATSTPKTTNALKSKKGGGGGGRVRRGFGWGRGRQAKNGTNNKNAGYSGGRSSGDTVSAESMGGQSLTYSTGSSLQSAGESTASSGFSRMLKVLDAEDGKNTRMVALNGGGHRRVPSAGQSVASSLNYSDSDASYSRFGRSSGNSQRSVESMDYSTDASESQLEGSKLIQMLMNEPTHGPPPPVLKNHQRHSAKGPSPTMNAAAVAMKIRDDDDDDSVEPQDAFDLKVEAARAPVQRSITRRTSSNTNKNSSGSSTSSSRQLNNKVAPAGETPNSSMSSPPNSILNESAPKDTTATTSSSSSKKQSEKHRWACSLEALEDAIPANVKTFLRPFLCGVL